MTSTRARCWICFGGGTTTTRSTRTPVRDQPLLASHRRLACVARCVCSPRAANILIAINPYKQLPGLYTLPAGDKPPVEQETNVIRIFEVDGADKSAQAYLTARAQPDQPADEGAVNGRVPTIASTELRPASFRLRLPLNQSTEALCAPWA